jgi:hypothetical protein
VHDDGPSKSGYFLRSADVVWRVPWIVVVVEEMEVEACGFTTRAKSVQYI